MFFSINVIIILTAKKKKKSHVTISINTSKALDGIQHPFMIEILRKLNIEKLILNL